MDIKIRCKDNYTITGTLFEPKTKCVGAIMIAPATGIKRSFYIPFAEFLADNGYGVISYDNRGIGDSLEGKIESSKVSLQEWGQLDMPAVLETLQQKFPNQKYHIIGHSAGGQLIGLMYNAMDLTSAFNIAFSSGRLRNMELKFKPQAYFFMNMFIPLSNLFFGHTKSQWVGMGEPLPKKVAQQWSQWCNGKGYVRTVLGTSIKEHTYDIFDKPMLCINAIDDSIAITENVKDMLAVFTKAKGKIITLNPKEEELKEIGHMKFFSRKSERLWLLALDWLKKHN